MNWETIITGLVSGLAGIIAGLVGTVLKNRNDRKTADADFAQKVTEIAMRLVEPLEGRLVKLEKENALLRKKVERFTKRIAALMNGIAKLIEQIIQGGHEPCWKPDDWKDE